MEKYIELNKYVAVKLVLLLNLEINQETKKEELDDEFVNIFELEHRPIKEIRCIADCVRNQLLSFATYSLEPNEEMSEKVFIEKQKNLAKIYLLLYRFLSFISEVY